MDDTVQFSEAPLPALEDAVWVMQLLAQAVHAMLARGDSIYDFEEVGISSIDVPRILGYFAAQRLPAIGSSRPGKPEEKQELENDRVETLRDIWTDFLREDRIKRLPRELTFFEQQRDGTIEAAATGRFSFEYLAKANRDAHSFVRALLKEQGLDALLPLSPVNVRVVHDAEAKMYCAASDRFTESIRWTHQTVPHALPAIILAERVLAHEYLSHLVPRNRALGRAVLERWLVALLHEAYSAHESQVPWKSNLWPIYREDLENHIAGVETAKNPALNVVRTFGYAGVEIAAASLYRNAHKAFWRLTSEILTGATDEEEARRIDRLLLYFANTGPKATRRLMRRKWKNIQSLYENAGSPYGANLFN